MMERKVRAFVILGLVGVVLDRALKQLALAGVTFGPVSGGIRFELLPNPAVAFSIAFPPTLSLIVIPFIIALFALAALRLFRQGGLERASALSVVVVASLSNYLDRWLHGYVVDYVSLGNWLPVFNLSDVLIVSALLMFAATKEKVA
ncbi:MAG: signal peptidase II [Candidatus Kerfeldbacteria bacterium]|nr:signal peptidase II [Candidatus Kerfeldbacteria bacterium]